MTPNEIATLAVAILAVAISIASAVYAGVLSKTLSSSDFKAAEEVKSDTAKLLSSLRSLMHKGALSSTTKADIDISPEKAVIAGFLNSQTGFAYYSWVDEKSSLAETEGRKGEAWRVFFLYLAELSNASSAYQAARRAAAVELLFDQLTEADISKIAQFNSDLIKAITKNSKNREGNIVVKAWVEIQRQKSEENSSEKLTAKLKYLKGLGIQDPNIDMFLSTLSGDVAQPEAALPAGADPHMTVEELLRKYAAELANYPDSASTRG